MQVAAYIRISPRPDLETSPSPEQQFGMCAHFLAENGIPVAPRAFQDVGKSRDDMNRPGLWEAVTYAKGGILVAASLDRIGDVVAVETVMRLCKEHKTQLITVAEGLQENDADSELLRVIRGGIARHSKRKISEATRRHLQEKKRQGHRISRFPPFGFKFVHVGMVRTKRGHLKDDWRMVPAEEEVRVINAVKRCYNAGWGVSRIVREFRRKGTKVRGGTLSHKRAYQILKDAGIQCRGKWKTAGVPAINMGPQKGPASVPQINAQIKQAQRELIGVTK